jgi:UTP--glucose-1-phosphate uridylyltransferase
VLCGARHVGHEPFAVLLGDDLIDPRDRVLPRMAEIQQQLGGSVVLLLEVPHDQIHLYGCASVEETDTPDVVKVTGLVEKPSSDKAPSNLAIIGRYLLDPSVFDVLRETPLGRGGEIQLTDALQTMAVGTGPGDGVHGLIFRGRRYDTGDRLDYLKTVVRLASEREDLGPDFNAFLREFVDELPAI